MARKRTSRPTERVPLFRGILLLPPAGTWSGWYELPEPPSANRWWRKWRNRMVLSPEARAYIAGLRQAMPPRLLEGPVCLEIEWHRGAKRGDLDKRIGVVQDALQGWLVRNDAQVTRLVAERFEAPGDAHLRVRVTPYTPPTEAPDA